MSTQRVHSGRLRSREPRFVLQGVLIVLPALLLAGLGFWSLRQDRVLARAEATERAAQLAGELASRLVEALALTSRRLTTPEDILPTAPRQAAADPVLRCANLDPPRIAFAVDDQFHLVYPPPMQPWPTPAPVDLAALSPSQQAAWQTAQRALYAEFNPEQAIAALGEFLIETPPAPLAAQAMYCLGTLQAAADDLAKARPWFESVIREYPEVAGDTGVPWRTWAELQLLRLTRAAPDMASPRSAWLADLGADAVRRPSPLSEFLLDLAGELEDASDRDPDGVSEAATWQQVWTNHELARRLFEVWQMTVSDPRAFPEQTAAGSWFSFGSSQSWLITRAATDRAEAGGHRRQWCYALTEEDVRELVRRVVAAQPRPEYFEVSVSVAGATLRALGAGADRLAQREQPASTDAVPALAVGIYLADPGALWARQHTRTLLFGALIALSAAAVLAGFVTAWLAFRRQQRLNELKTNFVSSVSHELRAPLASVRLMAEELHDTPAPEASRQREYHRFILQETRRLSALVDNILDFARQEQGRKRYEFEPTDMVALVRETVQSMKPLAADHGVRLHAMAPDTDVTATADGRALQQVLVNLLDNAIKHSPAGSTVTVGLEAMAPAADGHGAPLRFWVEDHGEGIPPAEHTQIFERFYRRGSELRRQTQGVGLGLAIVKYTVEAHGGRVQVRSAVGQGSRFTVELPGTPKAMTHDAGRGFYGSHSGDRR